jgi:ABC-type glutathione transport system ATPase component
MNSPALELRGVVRTYRSGETDLHVLRGVDLVLNPGEIVALVAPSGTGKSTLLHLAGLLERPDSGEVFVSGAAAGTLNDDARTAIRRAMVCAGLCIRRSRADRSAGDRIAGRLRDAGAVRGLHSRRSCGRAARVCARC